MPSTIILILLSIVSCQAIDEQRLADAIKLAENSTKYPYGIKLSSGRLLQEPEARLRCLAIIHQRLSDWRKAGSQGDAIQFISKSYCPLSDKSDKHHQNKNWIRLVTYFYQNKKH